MTDKKATVNCGEMLTIAHATEFRDKLDKALEKSSNIELEAEDVKKVDTAGMQLLIALCREVEELHGKISWKKPSDVLVSAITTLGLKQHITF